MTLATERTIEDRGKPKLELADYDQNATLLPDQESMPVIDVRLGSGSSLNLTTGKKTSVNAWFLFPFESASGEFDDYVSRFQKELVFTSSQEHWRLWKFYPVRGWSTKRFAPSWYTDQGLHS